MANLNKATFIGNLTADPEIRYTQGGTPVANMRIAVNERRKSDGEYKDTVNYFPLVAWGKMAERCNEYLQKGSQIFFEGRIQNNEWTDKEGNKRLKTEFHAFNIQFLSRIKDVQRGQGAPAHQGQHQGGNGQNYQNQRQGQHQGGNGQNYQSPPQGGTNEWDGMVPF